GDRGTDKLLDGTGLESDVGIGKQQVVTLPRGRNPLRHRPHLPRPPRRRRFPPDHLERGAAGLPERLSNRRGPVRASVTHHPTSPGPSAPSGLHRRGPIPPASSLAGPTATTDGQSPALVPAPPPPTGSRHPVRQYPPCAASR